MKKHQCTRCKRHVSKTFEVSKKTGVRRAYCEGCIETLQNKGANINVAPDNSVRYAERKAAANLAAIANGSNRK